MKVGEYTRLASRSCRYCGSDLTGTGCWVACPDCRTRHEKTRIVAWLGTANGAAYYRRRLVVRAAERREVRRARREREEARAR